MKIKNIILIALTGILLSLVTSCTKDFEEINTSPNTAPEASPGFLLANVQKGFMDDYWGEWWNGRFGLLYAQYWAQNEYTDESRYKIRQNNSNTYWTIYYGYLNDLEEIIRINEEDPGYAADNAGPNNNQIAVAEIMKVYIFHMMTDVWGYIPYKQALNVDEYTSPAFTSTQDVYSSLISKLQTARDNITTGAGSSISGDIIYDGDMAKWEKFANSLIMRIGIRMSETSDYQASTITDAFNHTAGAITTVADNALLRYQGSSPNNNPMNEAYKTRSDFSVTDRFVHLLDSLNDPRLSIYAAPINEDMDTIIGMPYGLNQTNATAISKDSVSLPGSAILSPTAPGIFMESSEVHFIMSEVNGWDQTYYEQGVRQSMTFWGVPEAEINDYINNELDPANEQSVLTQKYIALYMQGLQAWSQYRRTGIPDLQAPEDGAMITMSTTIPTRRTYPSDEYNLNGDNLQDAIDKMGPDAMDTPLWWDDLAK